MPSYSLFENSLKVHVDQFGPLHGQQSRVDDPFKMVRRIKSCSPLEGHLSMYSLYPVHLRMNSIYNPVIKTGTIGYEVR